MFEGLVQPRHLLLGHCPHRLRAGRLPELGKTLGLAIRDSRRAMNAGEGDRHGAGAVERRRCSTSGESPRAPDSPVERQRGGLSD